MTSLVQQTLSYAPPGEPDSPVDLDLRYENFIGGQWVGPTRGDYSQNRTPVTGEVLTEVTRSTPEAVVLALDAAQAAKTVWGETSGAEAARVLNRYGVPT